MKHLRPFKFEKRESSKCDKLYIFVMYAGGDADGDIWKKYFLNGKQKYHLMNLISVN